jgi:hypothetical protein
VSYTHSHAATAETKPPETMAIPGSSFLQAVTYDQQNYSLTLDFKNGTQIVHRFVFPMVWQQFKETPSKGQFYSRSIKGKTPSINFRSSLKVSDLSRAMREHRGKNANKH